VRNFAGLQPLELSCQRLFPLECIAVAVLAFPVADGGHRHDLVSINVRSAGPKVAPKKSLRMSAPLAEPVA
jgi:hypothetical protein